MTVKWKGSQGIDMTMTKNLIFIGDSLTQWFDWNRRFPDYQVHNLGISGETVEGLLGRRDRIRSQIEEPAHIFLMTGINNIANGQSDIIAPYRELVRNLTTWYKQSTIVLQSILPVTLEWTSNDVIKNANRQIEQLASEQGAEYLDIYSLFVDEKGNPRPGYLSDDGVHLAAKGYKAWADEVERFLKG
jgi:lysophospholipase L1-like esterase